MSEIKPVYQYQHEETGQIGFVDSWQVENGFFEINPRLQKIGVCYPAAAYEALQKELELEKMMSVGYIAQGDRLSAENAAQAKRIAELEETNGLLQTQVHCLEMVAALKNGE